MAKAKKSKKEAQLKVTGFTDTSKLVFQAAPKRASMYDTVFDSLAKLKPGQSFLVPIPKGVEPAILQNRVNAAIRRGPVKPPAGCVFRKNTTVKGEIAVCCLKEKEATSIYKKERRADKQKGGKKREKAQTPAAASADAN